MMQGYAAQQGRCHGQQHPLQQPACFRIAPSSQLPLQQWPHLTQTTGGSSGSAAAAAFRLPPPPRGARGLGTAGLDLAAGAALALAAALGLALGPALPLCAGAGLQAGKQAGGQAGGGGSRRAGHQQTKAGCWPPKSTASTHIRGKTGDTHSTANRLDGSLRRRAPPAWLLPAATAAAAAAPPPAAAAGAGVGARGGGASSRCASSQ